MSLRFKAIKAGLIKPCQPTPLAKIDGEWRVIVPTYVREGNAFVRVN